MNTRFNVVLAGVLVLCGSALAQAPPQPTMDDLRKMYQAKEYKLCLQQIARVMRAAQNPASGWDKYALMLMRGDCLLRLSDGASAKAAYDAAEKSPDNAQSARGRAMSFLISRSPALKFNPKEGGSEPLSIADEANQSRAMAMLLSDELKQTQGQVRKAITAQNLRPIQEFLPRLLELYSLELTATGKTEQVDPILHEIGGHARDILNRELDQVDQRLASIQNSTAQPGGATMVQSGGVWWSDPGIVRRGLSPDDRNVLREAIDFCEQIRKTGEKGLRLGARLGGDIDAWNGIIARSQDLEQKAHEILEME